MPLDLNDPDVKKSVDEIVAKHLEESGAGMKRKMDELLKEKKLLADRLKTIPDDFDVDNYAKLQALAEKQREIDEKASGWEKLKGDLVSKHQSELQKVTGERDRWAKQYQESTVRSAMLDAIAKADGISPLLEPLIRSQVRFDEKEGVVVVDGDGNPRLKDGSGKALGIEDLIAELKANELYSGAFKASGASGGGAGGSARGGGGAGAQNPWKRESLNLTKQGEIAKSNPALAVRLKAEAGVK
jgi:hypothetical protein